MNLAPTAMASNRARATMEVRLGLATLKIHDQK